MSRSRFKCLWWLLTVLVVILPLLASAANGKQMAKVVRQLKA